MSILRTATGLQGIEDRIRKLYGNAGDMGVEWDPKITLNVDAGSLTDPGTNVFRGRRWTYQSSLDLGAAATANAVHFWSPTIVERIWWVAYGPSNQVIPVNFNIVEPGSGIAAPFRTLFWRELYDADYVNGNPPMFNSGWAAGSAAPSGILIANATPVIQYHDYPIFFPGQLPGVTAGNVHSLQFNAQIAHPNGVAWGCSGRMF